MRGLLKCAPMSGQLFFFCGDDDYLLDTSARERIHALIPPQDRQWGVEIIDGQKTTADEARKAVDACMESVQTGGFFSGSKATWLRNATFLTGGERRVSETEAAKTAVAKMTEWLKGGLLDGQILVITAAKALRSSVFFKTCRKIGTVEDFGSGLKPWERERDAEHRLDRLIRDAGLVFAPGAKAEFLRRTGVETRLIVQELEKLKMYVSPGTEVTAGDIREITSVGREAEAWDLLDAFGERDAWKALETLHRLGGRKGIGIMIAAMLDKAVRDLLILREAHDRHWIRGGSWAPGLPPADTVLLNALPVNPQTMNAWALKRKLPHALNYTLRELRLARHLLLEMREKLVSTQLPEMFLLETALLKIIGRPKKTAPGTRQAAGAR